jgi:hypothetical protein
MWIDWYRKYQPADPEYEDWCRVSEANESQTSYSVKQADIFQHQPYSHSDDIFIILRSNINTDTSIFVFSREKSLYQIRNCRFGNINKHRPTKMYLSQFLITSAETSYARSWPLCFLKRNALVNKTGELPTLMFVIKKNNEYHH